MALRFDPGLVGEIRLDLVALRLTRATPSHDVSYWPCDSVAQLGGWIESVRA
jgi:hypothetical protein